MHASSQDRPRKTSYFDLGEVQDGPRVRLRPTGEIDLVTAPLLKERLMQLRTENRAVCLDLSGLEFMDSSGIHLLINALDDARQDGWQFTINRELPPQISRLFRLVNLDRLFAESALSSC
jgi:anti-sigma B factor antagonist